MDFPNTIINKETIDDIIISLGTRNDDFRSKHTYWKFIKIDNFIFPKDNIDDTNKTVQYLQNLFEGKSLIDVRDMIVNSTIEYNFRGPILFHLSQLISNAKVSQEIVEMKNSIKDLNDKFAILMDVLELNKPK